VGSARDEVLGRLVDEQIVIDLRHTSGRRFQAPARMAAMNAENEG
jgi:hypothetical protein